ncbi:MAG TPA: hypothetical protein DEB10_08180, partial [Ruminococcaceae bacterium]|nr:hypothetical protein [Oscillospiraceae bacterium]
MKKHWKIISLSLLLVTVITTSLFLSGYKSKSEVTVALDKMLSDESLGMYSHTMFYAQKHPELYNEIINMGENAISDLLIDFVDNPENDVRKNVIIDLVNQIVQKDELTVSKSIKEDSLQTSFSSSNEWFEQIGKNLYTKYVGELDS